MLSGNVLEWSKKYAFKSCDGIVGTLYFVCKHLSSQCDNVNVIVEVFVISALCSWIMVVWKGKSDIIGKHLQSKHESLVD